MIFCKHDWEKLSDVVLPSAFEQAVAANVEEFPSSSIYFFRKAHSVVVSCKRCGKLESVKTVNP